MIMLTIDKMAPHNQKREMSPARFRSREARFLRHNRCCELPAPQPLAHTRQRGRRGVRRLKHVADNLPLRHPRAHPKDASGGCNRFMARGTLFSDVFCELRRPWA